MPRQSKTKSSKLEALARRQFVFELRRTGAGYHTIAQTMLQHPTWGKRVPQGYDERVAHKDVMWVLQSIQDDLGEHVGYIRQQELDRLDRMLLGVWSRAQQGDDRAIASVLGIMARRAKYIPGLEVPTPIAPTNVDGTESYKLAIVAEPEITDEYVKDVAGLLAQYGLYALGAHATNGTSEHTASNSTPEPTP